MNEYPVLQDDWLRLLSLLPGGLEASAKRSGAMLRHRRVGSAATLLRLALAYGYCDLSLRATAAWASEQGIAELSDVAVLKRLKRSADWLGELLMQKLAERAEVLQTSAHSSGRVRLIDATGISQPGSQGTDWRLHMSLDLGRLSIDQVSLYGPHTAEGFQHFSLLAGEIVVADRWYAQRQQLALVAAAQADIVVRLGWHSVPLESADGQALDLLAALRALQPDQVLDLAVCTQPQPSQGLAAMPGRLIAVRKSDEAAEAARQKILKHARKKSKTPDTRTLEAAGYFFVFTTLPSQVWSANDVLGLYRLRWQVEMAFKRLKSLLALDALTAKDPQLARTYLLAKLLAALLVEDLVHQVGAAFSPWGYGLPAPLVPMAAVANSG
jgi:hypothetical protein